MKRTFTYLAVVVFFLGAVGFIIVKHNKGVQEKAAAVFGIKERRGVSAQSPEWPTTRSTASSLLGAIKRNPNDTKSKLALTGLFIQEARVTGDYYYYDAAAMKYVNDVLNTDPASFEALIYKAIVQLSQHHFAEGLATAMEAQKINSYNAFVYGIIVDAHVELGNYPAAVANADQMVSIRPDLRSYSRIAYLREIHGDMQGAIDAMKLAVEAGMPGQEGTEWCRVQLGQLYEYMGNIKAAEAQYQISLDGRPGYPYALAGMGRIALSVNDYEKAADYYRKAYNALPDFSFNEKLVEIYRLQKMDDKADDLAKEIIGKMTEAIAGNKEDSAGHYSDRELAFAYLAVNNTGKALTHAMQEFNRRPDNIDVNETAAWIYYKQGSYDKAARHIKIALRTNSKHPVLLGRAGLIYHKTGANDIAIKMLQEALQHNPNISPDLKFEFEKTFDQLSNRK